MTLPSESPAQLISFSVTPTEIADGAEIIYSSENNISHPNSLSGSASVLSATTSLSFN